MVTSLVPEISSNSFLVLSDMHSDSSRYSNQFGHSNDTGEDSWPILYDVNGKAKISNTGFKS